MTAGLSFERAASAEPMDARVTITLLVTSAVLSGMRLQGADFDFLVPRWEAMPAEPWRFFTAALLHGGWIHLIFNVFWTFRFGVLLEAMLGSVRLALVTLVLAGGPLAAEWAFSGPGVGLSGLVYGYFGILWSLNRWHPSCRGILDRRVTELLVGWFLLCILLSWYGVLPIANVAHGAGALLGGLLGRALAADAGRATARYALFAGTCVLIGLLATVLRPTVNRSSYYVQEAFQRGVRAYQAGDNRAAEAHFRAVVSRVDDANAWHNLSLILREQGEWEAAQEALEMHAELERRAAEGRSR